MTYSRKSLDQFDEIFEFMLKAFLENIKLRAEQGYSWHQAKPTYQYRESYLIKQRVFGLTPEDKAQGKTEADLLKEGYTARNFGKYETDFLEFRKGETWSMSDYSAFSLVSGFNLRNVDFSEVSRIASGIGDRLFHEYCAGKTTAEQLRTIKEDQRQKIEMYYRDEHGNTPNLPPPTIKAQPEPVFNEWITYFYDSVTGTKGPSTTEQPPVSGSPATPALR